MCWPRFQVITVVRTFSACPFYIPHFTAILWFNALYPEESVWSKGVTLAVLATQKCICLVAHATHQSFPVSCQGCLNQVLQCAVTRLRDQKLSEGHSCSLPFHPETRRWPQHWFSILGVGGVVVFFIKYVTDLRFFSFSHLCEKWHTFVEGLFYRQSQTQNLWYILYTFLVEGFRILKADWLSRFLSILLTQLIERFGAVCSHWTGKVFVCFFLTPL